jgi:hypothetical protein
MTKMKTKTSRKETNMNRVQKMAWWTLFWAGFAFVSSGIAMTMMYFIKGFPAAFAGSAFLGLFGLAGLSPILFKKDTGRVGCDERDRYINHRAALAAFTTSYLVMGMACMIPFFVMGPNANISIIWGPLIFMAGGMTCFVVHAAAILIQYGSDSRQEANA